MQNVSARLPRSSSARRQTLCTGGQEPSRTRHATQKSSEVCRILAKFRAGAQLFKTDRKVFQPFESFFKLEMCKNAQNHTIGKPIKSIEVRKMCSISRLFFGFCEKLDKTFPSRGQKLCKNFTKSQRFSVSVGGGSAVRGRLLASWSRRGYVLGVSGPLVESV